MFTKIKELPKKQKKRALKEMRIQRGYADKNEQLVTAFSFNESKYGGSYWSEIFLGLLTENTTPLSEIKVVSPEEVKVDSIVRSVISQFEDRSAFGIKKYGVTLDRNDLSTEDWVEHAKQEAMDFVLYLEKLKQKLYDEKKGNSTNKVEENRV